MVAAAQALERDYYVTPLDRVKTTPPDSDFSGIQGAEHKSDSNQIALRPKPRPHA